VFGGRRWRVISSSRTGPRLRRASVDVYGRRSNNRSYNDECLTDDELDLSCMSVHHEPLRRPQNLLTWRPHWTRQQPADTRDYSAAADQNYNNINNSKYTSLTLILYVAICRIKVKVKSSYTIVRSRA